MASITLVDSNSFDTGVITEQLTASLTAAAGDVLAWGANASDGTGVSCGGTGSWTQSGSTQNINTGTGFAAAFAASSGGTGQVALGATDNFRDAAFALFRPVDLGALLGVVGSQIVLAGTSNTAAITSSGSPGLLLAYCFGRSTALTITSDPNWTDIPLTQDAGAMSHAACYLAGDDSEVVFTHAAADSAIYVFEWAAAAGGSAPARLLGPSHLETFNFEHLR